MIARGTRFVLPLILFMFISVLLGVSSGAGRDLTFEERVSAQHAIERVYWKHRLWPGDNPESKPPFDAVLSDARIRAKVADYLKKSNALAGVWGRRISAAQLQSEMERMAAATRAPEVLKEIFAALDDDPSLIAETLARQVLADRLVRNWYARDGRFHAEVRRRAEAAMAGIHDAAQLKGAGGGHQESTWRLVGSGGSHPTEGPGTIALDASEWERRLDWLTGVLDAPGGAAPRSKAGRGVETSGPALDRLPLMTVSRLYEEDGAFLATGVLRKGPDAVTTVTAWWPKTSFDAWWADRSATLSSDLAPASVGFAAVEVAPASTCMPDTWSDVAHHAVSQRYLHTAVWTGAEMIIWGGHGQPGGPVFNDGGRYDPSTDTWTATTTIGAPEIRLEHTAVWTGTEMIVWGGDGAVERLNNGGRYNPSTDTWTAIATIGAPAGRERHTAIWTGGEMIVWGGLGNPGDPLGTGGRYTPSTNQWTATATSGAPAARVDHTAVWTGGEMIVWGGGGTSGPLNGGGRYAPSTNQWTATTTSGAPAARQGHTAVWIGGAMIVWGGDDGTGNPMQTGGRYDTSTGAWTPTATAGAPGARAWHGAVWTASEMIVWGGWNQVDLGDGGRYDPDTDVWVPVGPAGSPEARRLHTTVWTGSEMIVWGGYNNGTLGDGGRYDPASDGWVAIGTGGIPIARTRHTAVWTGSEMIVWGGEERRVLDTGGLYDPATDSWRLTATAGAPSARTAATAVWTGSEMIIWGGLGAGSPTSGGRYDPATDTWMETTTVAAPVGRSDHTALWTGSEMIVWGGSLAGSGGGTYLDDGGRYDPSTDTWVPTGNTGSPRARRNHSAAWTGGEMIVWGGSNAGSSNLDHGDRYDPAADAWTPVGTAGAPAGRRLHKAVWTGTWMIVWGGRGAAGRLNSGGRYDPSTDIWAPTTTSGAPAGREAFTAVWTGDEMIVWGGLTISAPPGLNTGGRYDPSADTWTSTTTDGAPGDRYLHTAVWTGSEMIVWGGFGPYVNELGTGGRYCVGSCDMHDVTPPDLVCPGDVLLECPATAAALGTATAADACDPAPTVTSDALFPLPLGTNVVSWHSVDASGNAATCQQAVSVVDTMPPSISVSPAPPTLWPPNHRLVQVGVAVETADVCDAAFGQTPSVVLTGATSSEPDDRVGPSDGNTAADIQDADVGTADFLLELRAERDGDGTGRTYVLVYEAADGAGNRAVATGSVLVPHDQGGTAEPLVLQVQETAQGTTLSWDPVSGAVSYDVVRGNVASLREIDSMIDLGPVTCILGDVSVPSSAGHEDRDAPALGEAYFYLVSYDDVWGSSGYGSVSAFKPRIVASGGCP